MSGEEPSETLKILLEVKKQMAELEGKVDNMQRAGTSSSFDADPEETEDSAGMLVELSEETSAFLKAAFSTTLSNADRRKRIAHIGIPDCNKIRCPKLDPMLATVLLKDAMKTDSYLSRLQRFWLDAVAPLAAILEGSDAGGLTPEQAYAAAQSALCLLGNANNYMAQERRKRVLMNVNPALKSMAEEENTFQQAGPMLFGEEFAKKATDRVEAVKAIKKITYSKPGEKRKSFFLDTTPGISRTATGVVSAAAAGDSSRTSRRPQLALDQATMGRKVIKNFTCTLFSKKCCLPTYSTGRSKSTVLTRCDTALYKKRE